MAATYECRTDGVPIDICTEKLDNFKKKSNSSLDLNFENNETKKKKKKIEGP